MTSKIIVLVKKKNHFQANRILDFETSEPCRYECLLLRTIYRAHIIERQRCILRCSNYSLINMQQRMRQVAECQATIF